ncbi:centromere protein X-like isoform X2 [Rhynchophorus ferrugineus]|uniref:centromere protein X-like isoform X2 n=1 Tax=Rhynchophorus ferrugineus TaxID=354439 RepID=UPI003FCDB912
MSEENNFPSKISTTFKHEVIKELLKSKFSSTKNKISEDAVELVVEIAKLLAIEAAARAANQAKLENKQVINLDHVECILPQMLDFA